MKIPDGLTLKMSHNVRKKTITVLAYRKGRFKYAYKAVLPMCDCGGTSPHFGKLGYSSYHNYDVDGLIQKLVKSYS